MLIKSQDGKSLTDISEMTLSIVKSDDAFMIYAYGNQNEAEFYELDIGEYSTEERAIDVLKQISLCYANYSRKYFADCSKYAVFEMPK